MFLNTSSGAVEEGDTPSPSRWGLEAWEVDSTLDKRTSSSNNNSAISGSRCAAIPLVLRLVKLVLSSEEKKPQEKLYDGTGDINILSPDNFDSVVLNDEKAIWVVQFYSSSCTSLSILSHGKQCFSDLCQVAIATSWPRPSMMWPSD